MSSGKSIALDRILAAMHLRQPQKEALEAFHKCLIQTDIPLSSLTKEEVVNLFRNYYPSWSFEHGVSEFTFHLATGVGKTRLIGALIAYLFIAKESKNFMIVSPRSEIIRKFIHSCMREGDKYLFVDPQIVDFPTVLDANKTVSDYAQAGIFDGGPRIWILSPQAFTASGAKLKKKTENDVCSPVEYIRELDDLVIFFDESHHLSFDAQDDSVWRSELLALEPKMIIGTTGSIVDGQNNIIYSYDLKKCLNEHLYTKYVRIIPEKRPNNINDDDFDHLTLRVALKRLEFKQKCIEEYRNVNGIEKKVKAAMLVACENIEQATAITRWIQNYLQSTEAVLLVHSRLPENEFLPRLQKLEDPDSPVKIVVNVSMLNEGWDVSNVYVITPLRAMASITLVTQIMGRGLRLPFGSQVGDEEVDTLDVLCYGNETMQEITDKLIREGFGTGVRGGITVDPPVDPENPNPPVVPKKKIKLTVSVSNNELRIPQFQMKKAVLPLDEVSIPPLKPQQLHYFMIDDPRTIKRLGGKLEYDRAEFISIVATDVVNQCTYLSYSRHFTKMKALVNRFLISSKCPEGPVILDPSRVVAHIKENLDLLNKQLDVSYVLLPDEEVIDLTNISITVPETYSTPFDNSMEFEWDNRRHKGIPFAGWSRAVFEAMPFDTKNEFKVAKIIDSSSEVKLWFRNLPGILTLATPAGNYSPDFAIFLVLDEKNVLLELKDDDRFGREEQDATIKAKAAREWCKAQSEASGKPWEYWLLLDSDAVFCQTLDDVRDNSDIEG